MTVTLELPTPPTVNNLYANGKKGRYCTPRYLEWQEEAGWLIVSKKPPRITGPVTINVELNSKVRGDPDNYLKPLLDICVKFKLIEGDGPTIVRSVNASLSSALFKGVRVIIEPVAKTPDPAPRKPNGRYVQTRHQLLAVTDPEGVE